ncbi:MAG: DUF1573 domain-containing protein [Candidatus Kapabacteria bacterium]|nr:DUF1573 domain-containing protein [Candidatus Kapabacteria bacterium]
MIKSLFVVLALIGLSAGSVYAQPKLEVVGGETYDWGKVKPPKEGHLEAEIKMKNVGDRAMKLTEVRPGCGCTKTDPDKFELAPGEVSTMKVKLNISPAQSGPVMKNITVSWADLEGNKALTAFRSNSTPVPTGADTVVRSGYIWLKADVQRELMFTPSIYFSFNDLKVGQESTSKLDVVNNSDKDVIFSDWTTEGGIVCNQATRVTLKPGQKLEIIAKLIPSVKGNYTGGVKVKTSNPDNAEVDLKAYGFVQESTSPVFQNPTTPKQ